MKNNKEINNYIPEYDEPILKFITDIKTERMTNGNIRVMFDFSTNEYFNNTILEKLMIFKKDDPTVCIETKATKIEWNEGKNVTIKYIKRKNKDKSIFIIENRNKANKIKNEDRRSRKFF